MFDDTDIQKAKEKLPSLLEVCEYIHRPYKELYICPYCNSGLKEKRTPALKINGNGINGLWAHCFACGKNFDAIQLYRDKNCCDFRTAVEALSKGNYTAAKRDFYAMLAPHQNERPKEELTKEQRRAYLKDCYSRLYHSPEGLPGMKYLLEGRKLSVGACQLLGFGYDNSKRAITIPFFNMEGYTLRYIHNTLKRYEANGHNGFSITFEKLKAPKPLFVTEGAFDACSILTCQKPAIALNSCANAKKFCNFLKENLEHIKAKIIICLDNDTKGQEASQLIASELQPLGVLHSVMELPEGDPNSYLVKYGRTALTALLEAAEHQ